MNRFRGLEFGYPYLGRGPSPSPQPEWSPEAFLVEGGLPSPRFERDVEDFRSETARINRLMPLEDELPRAG